MSRVLLPISLVLLALCWGCGDAAAPKPVAKSNLKLEDLLAGDGNSGKSAPEFFSSPIRIRTVTDTGINFQHQSGNSDERPFPAANGSGVGVIDFDLDGLPDLFFANGTEFPIDLSNQQWRDALYRNVGGFSFQDCSQHSGVDFSGYSAGVAVGDFDHDGFPDLFINCYGVNRLYRNQGDGTFVEVSAAAGMTEEHWGTSAVWFDFNNDGLLDLYVGNYAIWDLESNKFCRGVDPNERIFCNPRSVAPAPDFLYLNRGDGTFEDITDSSGVGNRLTRTQGVLAADFNGDGWTDLYLGNDMHVNSLFINRGDLTFLDMSDTSGMGQSSSGHVQAGMGVAAADTNRNGKLEVFVTNYSKENNNFYQQVMQDRYSDRSDSLGLAGDSMPWVGWGAVFSDLNMDGWPDLIATNGHTDHNIPNEPYAQPPMIWQNVAGRFHRISADSGDYLQGQHVGRGLATVDLDGDGRSDMVFAHLGNPPAIVMNETPDLRAWILQLEGTTTNRDAVGVTIELESDGDNPSFHRVGGGSYLSQSETLIYIPYQEESTTINIRWSPTKESQLVLDDLPINRWLLVRETK